MSDDKDYWKIIFGDEPESDGNEKKPKADYPLSFSFHDPVSKEETAQGSEKPENDPENGKDDDDEFDGNIEDTEYPEAPEDFSRPDNFSAKPDFKWPNNRFEPIVDAEYETEDGVRRAEQLPKRPITVSEEATAVISNLSELKFKPKNADATPSPGSVPAAPAVREARANRGAGRPAPGINRTERFAYRPERVKRLGCMGGILYFVFVVCISALLAGFGWLAANDVLALDKTPHAATVKIPEHYTISKVASELSKAGLIDHPWLFRVFADFTHADKKIDPGTYELDTSLDYRALISKMQDDYDQGDQQTVKLTFIEGMTLTEIINQLAENGICSADSLWDTAANHNFAYDFLDSKTIGSKKRLEGYLFPDTYEFYTQDDPEFVFEKFLDNFNSKITEDMKKKAASLGRSLSDIVTIASLIEKETSGSTESPYISSVIYNRLENWDEPFLQVDATIQYILPERKKKLTAEDMQINSPYNTYMYTGLPPTAIANPGLASINAALNPANTDFYYYALNKDGFHEFFEDMYDFTDFVNSDKYGG